MHAPSTVLFEINQYHFDHFAKAVHGVKEIRHYSTVGGAVNTAGSQTVYRINFTQFNPRHPNEEFVWK